MASGKIVKHGFSCQCEECEKTWGDNPMDNQAKATPKWKAIEQDGQVNLVGDAGIIQAIVADIETGNELANKLNNHEALLEALKVAVELIPEADNVHAEITMIRQAIAKAEGR